MSHPAFQLPAFAKITGRTSTITNAFVQSLIPVLIPTREDVIEALGVLGIDPDDPTCAYCGDATSEWDHLRPLVRDRMPTGFISEIGNLVPSCGKCNQSKGNKDWREWMLGSARLSPASRGVADLDTRVGRLDAFADWRTPVPIDLESISGAESWAEYWSRRDSLVRDMRECQILADDLRERILRSFKGPR